VSQRNAHAIALFLESHPGVTKVVYPGLPSHPQHELVKRQQHGFGSMITFYCVGGRKEAATFLQKVRTDNFLHVGMVHACISQRVLRGLHQLRVFTLAESLGAVESLAESPSLMTHASVPDKERAKLGIDDSLIRLSVGVESCRDLVDDLERALDAALEQSSSTCKKRKRDE
jgi:cystathionine gamma-lyase